MKNQKLLADKITTKSIKRIFIGVKSITYSFCLFEYTSIARKLEKQYLFKLFVKNHLEAYIWI